MTEAENVLLTRVGPTTPMGRFLRQYWLPFLLLSELSGPGGRPSRVRLLGEDLVAIRAPDGRVGLMSSRCPHRGASLVFGRNEEGGLRCCYHGWKFSLEGTCVETPNEPPESPLTKTIRVAAYPCLERNGVIWTYMGSQRPLPPLPDFEWNLSPDNVPFMWRNYRACNWLQALEGDIDSSHAGFLHARLDDRDDDSQYITVPGAGMPGKTAEAALRLVRKVKAPSIEIVDTDYGVMYTAKRPADEEREYHRIHHYLYPLYTMVGGGIAAEELCYNGKVWLPMDDTSTLALEWQFRPGKPWTDEERQRLLHVRNPHGFLPATNTPGGAWLPRANASNEYFRDDSLERDKLFLGIASNPLQDAAVQESMGPIVDRSKEHLGMSDAMIIRVRRRLLRCLGLMEDDARAPGVDTPEIYQVRPVGIVLEKGADWASTTKDLRKA